MTVITTPEKSSTDPVTTPTTSKSTKTTSVSGEKMNNSTTVKTVTTPKRSSSEPATTPTTSTSTITTFVSVLTPIVSIIAVVSLTVVCWRRRNEKATVHVQAPKEKTTKHVVPRDPEGHETLHQPNENYQSHASSDTFKENNVPCSANKMNLYDTANFNIDDGTYDVTFSVNNPIRAVQANSYDHVRLKKTNDGKYDHVDLQDQNNTAYELDTYDKTNALTLDNTQYNTFQEKFKPHQQFKANVYDAANFHPTK
ncbi:hypothetical protein CHS0354_012391 [Potamilus streckersoni]|uniref:Uncharacterized protein n=1 Tax=Potamilus streckersoni TaxID=2493646 RepID=A0AAE0RZA8_9BIVA|nr:hypothetical protein CHS0354_012391 [Potamilus streckersoni]